MKFLAIIALLSVSAHASLRYKPCPSGIYSERQCCATDVLGLADLNCKSPPSAPKNAVNFKRICAINGKTPKCCALPIAGQSALCETPVGV